MAAEAARCRERVLEPGGWRFHRCSRNAKHDAVSGRGPTKCFQHSHEAVVERRRKQDEKYEREQAARREPAIMLAEAKRRIKLLEEELTRVGQKAQVAAAEVDRLSRLLADVPFEVEEDPDQDG